MNLLKETIGKIEQSGHTLADVIFIGSEGSGYSCTWDEFTQLADTEYDDGFGGQKVAKDLIVVFADGQKMWRSEYDGSEGWEVSTPFHRPEKQKPIKSLFAEVGWDSLDDINGSDQKTS